MLFGSFLILFIIQFYLQHNLPFGRYTLGFLGMTCPNNIIFLSQLLREQTKQVHIQHHANLIQQICINRLTLEKMIYQRPFFVNHTSELAGTQTTFLDSCLIISPISNFIVQNYENYHEKSFNKRNI